MIPRLCSSLYFRHLDRISAILIPGVSSMIRLERPMISAPSTSFVQSSSFRLPVRIFCESTCDSIARSRFTSCSFDISRLNIATVTSLRNAIYCAMFRTNAVLPIEGRAAIKTRSDGCIPDVL